MRILLFKAGALGDILMTTPLVRQLRECHPQATIDYLVGDQFASVIKGNQYIDSVKTFDASIIFRKRLLSLNAILGQMRGYDRIFVLDRHWIFACIAWLAQSRECIGFARDRLAKLFLTSGVPYKQDKHDIHAYLDLMAVQDTIDNEDTSMDIFSTKEEEEQAAHLWKAHTLSRKRVVALAPGGGENQGQDLSEKRWPLDHYRSLAKMLIKKGFSVVVVGGPLDRERGKTLEKVGCIDLTGRSIGMTAATLKRCAYVVCNDGGAMHIAAASNPRIIALFGPTNPAVLAPLSPESVVLRSQDVPTYDIRGKLTKKYHPTINEIKPEHVMREIL